MIAFGAALLASYQDVQARILQGEDVTKTTLFLNNSEVKDIASATDPATAETDTLKWVISNQSWIDEDTGYEYLELINTLSMPIISTDFITFHVEFTNSEAGANPTDKLFRDGFECTLEKQLTTDYWDTTTKDIYVRTTKDTAAVDDYNNSVENDGQDYFVFQADADREDADHLCTTSTTDGVACDSIRCIVRRKMITEDPDDFTFAPTDATFGDMTFPGGYSYILMNQNDSTTLAETSKQRLNTLVLSTADVGTSDDASMKIKKGALDGLALSAVAFTSAFLAMTAF